ncbi:TAXI family TRAP transporter solute-binding subunit [Psychromarinibacter halotolerans]|uniref:TAXI family TRAP transporter solute-binding subunit n=1 Tax=Psychromarinibacter halotolerans TaxID=1775175 RepID=A0ABV7GVD9_9RHOB|nr:TAXI family TRAP transporter solute-binding subunit [Psychromarinibacter halotolerans]MDF0595240.1 TAXI family TRAP transporter solute-binding subunit [Psychromarinibacter halotolerans]
MTLKSTLAGILVAGSLAGALAGGAQAQTLGIGTMGQGTSGYSMGSAIAKVLADNGVNALVQPSAGTSAYLPLIDMGELDLGIANAIEVAEAMTGTGVFEGKQLANIAPAARLYPFHVGVFVRDDSGIETIADLAGKSVTYGYTSQVTINRVVDAILASAELSEADVTPVMVPNVVRGAEDFAAGRADGAFFAIGSGKVTETDAAVGGLHFVPVPDDEASVARLQEIVPQAYVTTIEPADNRTGVDEAMPVMAYDYMLVVGAHVPDETVGEIVTILRDNADVLAESFGGFRGMDPDDMIVDIDVPYHPGAVAALGDN